jgi:hypothetical protein
MLDNILKIQHFNRSCLTFFIYVYNITMNTSKIILKFENNSYSKHIIDTIPCKHYANGSVVFWKGDDPKLDYSNVPHAIVKDTLDYILELCNTGLVLCINHNEIHKPFIPYVSNRRKVKSKLWQPTLNITSV